MKQFIYTTRVYYSDTDAGGVVYHADYLKYMEHARAAWFLSFGFNVRDWHDKGVCFAVHSTQLNYLKPARLLDELQVTCDILKVGKASLEIKHVVRNTQDNDLIYCQGIIKLACVNDNLCLQSIPNELSQQLK
ncbi:MAG: YbgC/FadM family acyl-CoA thioesterase [Gammaproteobacteria bacterium]|jgi:tol-pal system-associated acyl-CoA thioesterase